jgi:hypothetical protein
MKTIKTACLSLFILVGLIAQNIQAQCIANAGNDTTLCIEDGFDSYFLGGSPTALNGTPPYSYAWTCTVDAWTLTFTEDDFLDDPSSPNPQLIDFWDDSLVFHLTVTDDLGLICTDTVIVHFCQFVFQQVDKEATINSGDSVQLYPSTWNNCEPLIFEWTPNYNISDPTIAYPTVWPEIDTDYTVTVTNSAGCTAIDDEFDVDVIPLSVFNNSSHLSGLKIYPMPIAEIATIEHKDIDPHNSQIHFYDTSGRLVQQFRLENNSSEINHSDFNAGLYFYRVFENGQPIHQGKIIFE